MDLLEKNNMTFNLITYCKCDYYYLYFNVKYDINILLRLNEKVRNDVTRKQLKFENTALKNSPST